MSPLAQSVVSMIGLWTTTLDVPSSLLGFPHPSSLADPAWETERRDNIVGYLRGGHTIAEYMGQAFCRFRECRGTDRHALGTKDLSDGTWAWPEGLWHYVADHHLRLPDEFVAHAAAHGFTVPAVELSEPVFPDVRFWLRWVAENSPPPHGQPGACSLAEAQAICAELSTVRWSASVVSWRGRWKLRREGEGRAFEDFTGPITADSLRTYLFRFRLVQPESVLSPRQAEAIAREYERDGHAARLFAGRTDKSGHVWWALITSGTDRPTKTLDEIDLDAIKIPEPGWSVFLPSGWKVSVARGMDERAWRHFLTEWRHTRSIPRREEERP